MIVTSILAAAIINTAPIEVQKPTVIPVTQESGKIPDLFNPDCKEKTLFQDFSTNAMVNTKKE